MYENEMNARNVLGGLKNKEIAELIGKVRDPDDPKEKEGVYFLTLNNELEWQRDSDPTPSAGDLSYTVELEDFVLKIGLQDNHPTLQITETSVNKVVAIVDAEYPPDLSVRAKLAGDVFGLVMLVSKK